MAQLVPISELIGSHNYDLGSESFNPVGATAYGMNDEKIGKVTDALAEDGGKLRYLVVEIGSWFTSKHVLLPVGLARFSDADDAVYFDTLDQEQAKGMSEYVPGRNYTHDAQSGDERVLRGSGYTGDIGATDRTAPDAAYNYRDEDATDTLYKTPTKLQLLEERLLVNKEKYRAGSVEVGKRVETRQESVGVDLSHDEVVIERTPVTEARPVEGNVVLGAATETIRVDLEAERANVQKQAYVTEEVSVGKRSETEHQTVSDTVGREVLDVTKTGEVTLSTNAPSDTDRK